MPRCPRCRGPLVQIKLTLGETDLTMRSCTTCDRRWWHHGEVPVDFDGAVPAARRARTA